MSGGAGSTSPPTHEITTRAVTVSPRAVVSAHVPAVSSKRAAVIAVSTRRWGRRPKRSTSPRRYDWISPDGEKRRVHPGFCAKDKEYAWDGTSQAAPG